MVRPGASYWLSATDDHVGPGATLEINAMGLGADDAIAFDGSAESNGRFLFLGGEGVTSSSAAPARTSFSATPAAAYWPAAAAPTASAMPMRRNRRAWTSTSCSTSSPARTASICR